MHLSSVVSGRGHNTLESLWLARRLPSWALERYIECSDNIRPVLSHVLVTVLATPKQRNTSWLATCVTMPNCGELNVLFCYKAAELHVHALFWDLHMPHPHAQHTLEHTLIQPTSTSLKSVRIQTAELHPDI